MNRFTPSRQQLKEILAVARGDAAPDLIIQNVQILDLVNGTTSTSHVAIKDRWIAGIGDYTGDCLFEASGLTIVPGFIDAHTHVESSLMHPFEFEAATIPHGTLTTVCDPHEIGNVLGEAGIAWFLRCAELMTQKMLVQIPSCVPSLPGFETNGGALDLSAMRRLKDSPYAFGLGEMMNTPGVIQGNDAILDKLDLFQGYPLDGHAPTLTGKNLNAYRAAGLQNCHETVTASEAQEKLRIGMAVMLREGSVAKNLATLACVVNNFNSHQCLLCTDDRNPFEIHTQGHIDFMVRTLIQQHQFPPYLAYRLSSYSAALHYGIKRLGLIAPGYQADFLLLDNLENVSIKHIFIDGKPVELATFSQNSAKKFNASNPPISNSMKSHWLQAKDLQINLTAGTYNVIGVIPNEIITTHLKIDYSPELFVEKRINKIAVLERYHQTLPPSLGLVAGFDLITGAFASSVAHDSHNVIGVGANDSDLCLAMNHLKLIGGGFVVVKEGQVKAEISLSLAGLMSLESAPVIADKLIQLKLAIKELGCELHEPLLQLGFLALPVIPALKITDKGLIETTTFTFINLKQESL